mgnify:FL=1
MYARLARNILIGLAIYFLRVGGYLPAEPVKEALVTLLILVLGNFAEDLGPLSNESQSLHHDHDHNHDH